MAAMPAPADTDGMAQVLYRYLQVPDQTDEGNLRLAFSSEAPVLRIGSGRDHPKGEKYFEVLDHTPANADISILENDGAFLDEHDFRRQLGVIESVEICADKKGRAEISFCDDQLSKDRSRQLRSKKRPHISFGYIHTRLLSVTPGPKGIPTKRFAWQAYEISSVAVPADGNVGVGRSISQPQPQIQHRMKSQPQYQATEELEVTEDPNQAGEERRRNIMLSKQAFCEDHPHVREQVGQLAAECIADGTAAHDFCKRATALVVKHRNQKPLTRMLVSDFMSPRDAQSYSLMRAIQSCIRRKSPKPDGMEQEVSQEISKRTGEDPEGFYIPPDLACNLSRANGFAQQMGLTRDVGLTVAGTGGNFVESNVVTPIIEILRNRTVCLRLGAQTLGGLQGNAGIPRQTSTATAEALGEVATLTKSGQTIDQPTLVPHRVGAYGDYSKQLLLQSSVDVESFVRADLMSVLAIKHDALIINGQGANSEPLGILNTPGIGSIVFGAAASWGKVVDMETAIASLNADVGPMAYVTTPTVRGAWKKIAIALTGATTVSEARLWDKGNWGDGSDDGEVNSRRAAATNQIPNNIVLCGIFNQLLTGMWGGFDVVVDPYTGATEAQVRIVINTWIDSLLRHAQAFIASADAGNQ